MANRPYQNPIEYGKADWYYDDEAQAATIKLEESGFAADWEVVVAQPDTLQIDWDKKTEHVHVPSNFHQMMGLLVQRFNVSVERLPYQIYKSKGGGNHIVITLPEPMDAIEKIAWQAAFGSDGKREALNLLRVKRNIKNPILLFMAKNRDYKVFTAPVERRIKGGK